jgi:hypothetical protein
MYTSLPASLTPLSVMLQGQTYGYNQSIGMYGAPVNSYAQPSLDPFSIVANASHQDLTQTGHLAYAELLVKCSSANAELVRVSGEP